MKLILFLVCSVLCYSLSVRAQESVTDEDIGYYLDQCLSADSSSNVMGQLACIEDARLDWELKLKMAYDSLHYVLDKSQQETLEKAQLKWEESANADAEFLSYFYQGFNGTMYKSSAEFERLTMIEERVRFLRYMLEQYQEENEE